MHLSTVGQGLMDDITEFVVIVPGSFAEAALLEAVGLLTSAHAIALAEAALIDGSQSSSILELASLSASSDDGWRELLRDALSDLEIEIPSPSDAAYALALMVAHDLVTGVVDPIDGARYIWQNLWQPWRRESITPFVGLLDELEDRHPPTREESAQRIRDYAGVLVGTNGNPGDERTNG